jgi:thymidylate synthase
MEIKAINVNELFTDMLWRFKTSGVKVNTRNGPAIRIDEPVLTTIIEPTERVLFFTERDANPIFHLMESIWMLAGRNDVAFLKQFNSTIGQFSDDGFKFNAAYGHRMRHHFGFDQLKEVIKHLKADTNSRQAVVQLWETSDFNKVTKDKACNTQLVFAIVNGALDITIFNRSNDFWWGYCGANPVHFSVIQEFVAIALEVPVGQYFTVSNNLHLYTELYNAKPYVDNPPNSEAFDAYSNGIVKPTELYYGSYELFLHECEVFCNDPFANTRYVNPFFEFTARPMAMVTYDRKHKISDGTVWANRILAADWKLATQQYIMNREKKNVSK